MPSPDDVVVLLNQGNRLCTLERFAEAVACYSAALAVEQAPSPLRAMLLSNRAMAHLEAQQAQAALADFDEALVVLDTLPEANNDAMLLAEVRRVITAGRAQATALLAGE